MSYQWFNRQKLLQKAKDRYHSGGGKEKAAEQYIKNREFLSEKEKNSQRNLSKTKISDEYCFKGKTKR